MLSFACIVKEKLNVYDPLSNERDTAKKEMFSENCPLCLRGGGFHFVPNSNMWPLVKSPPPAPLIPNMAGGPFLQCLRRKESAYALASALLGATQDQWRKDGL
jgi:hypothetical protein